MEIDIQQLLEKVKMELGNLTINNLTLLIQIEKLNEVILEQNKLLEAEKQLTDNLRINGAEDKKALEELRELVHPANQKRKEIKKE